MKLMTYLKLKEKILRVFFFLIVKDSKTRLVYASKSKYKVVVYDQEGANGFDCLELLMFGKKISI